MHDFIHNFIDYIVVFINKIGYLGIFIGMFLLLGLFTAWGLWMLSLVFELGQGAANWWNSQPEATGSSSNGNQVPPYFFLIPMFMVLGFLIRHINE